jgi:hypothetical protein
VRQQAHEITSRAEFQRNESWFDRVMGWIGDRLREFHFGIGSGPGVVGNILTIALLGVVGYVLYRLLRTINWSRSAKPTDDIVVESVAGKTTDDWRRQAEAHEAAGEWRDALLARYRELVSHLADVGVVADIAGRTTGELRAEVAAARPEAAAPFADATDVFEWAWYGGRATGADDNARFRELAQRVRGALVTTTVPA